MKKPLKETVSSILGVIVFTGLGILMIIHPEFSGYEPHGRNYLLKKVIVMVWGRPAGIILIIVGLLAFVGLFVPEDAPPGGKKEIEES